MPGSRWPESFTSQLRLMIDSREIADDRGKAEHQPKNDGIPLVKIRRECCVHEGEHPTRASRWKTRAAPQNPSHVFFGEM